MGNLTGTAMLTEDKFTLDERVKAHNNMKDFQALDSNGQEIFSSFNPDTGIMNYAKTPATVKYNYDTGISDAALMDVTVNIVSDADTANPETYSSGSGCDLVRSEGLGVRSVLVLALFLLGFAFAPIKFRRL